LRVSEIISSGNFARITELFPPGLPSPGRIKDKQKLDLSQRFERLIESISDLEALADAFSLPELRDGNRIHLNTVSIATELKKRTGSAVIPTVTLRDSNRQNLLGQISFAIFTGIENVQIVRGDPYRNQDGSEPKNVYDYSRVSDLVITIRKLESHLSEEKNICILAPLNLTKVSSPSYLKTVRKRESSGVDIFISESSFGNVHKSLENVQKLRKEGIRNPVIHSIFPLRDYEDAKACVEKFGWKVPEEELHSLKLKGAQYGIESARERYFGLIDHKDLSQGASISTRGNPELVRQIVT